MGFVATKAVEELTYDFNPHVKESGTIPEPSAKQVENYRDALIGALKETGLDPATIAAGKVSMSEVDDLMQKVEPLEVAMVNAVSDLTGISQQTLNALPFRIKAAFLGWVQGQFFSPEA